MSDTQNHSTGHSNSGGSFGRSSTYDRCTLTILAIGISSAIGGSTSLLLVALTPLAGWTTYSGQGASDPGLSASVTLAARQVVQGRRVELDVGTVAPFDGVLLDDAALALIASDRDSLRAEVAALREALDARVVASELDAHRIEMWKVEAEGTGADRFFSGVAKWGFFACAAGVTGAVLASR